MKLLICDDHELYREGLKLLIENYFLSQCVQIDEAINIEQVYDAIQHNPYDIILLDLSMPGSKGVLEVSKIIEQTAATVVVVSADSRPQTINLACEQGAKGYLLKADSSSTLLASLEKVMQGKVCFPKNVLSAKCVIKHTFSKRQLSVLHCLIEGSSNKEIAKKLFLSEGTVKQYVSSVLVVLGVENRTQAAIKGAEMIHDRSL
ncbi:hypothetical protein MNBD_GAMMA04-672 [hydrothermal vent metagenome]|uniref:Two-component transcriptional response regulator, LuxR family n=1 Tax=hydrothermal vent metagenome TaxID=652676 RepID=A0A3B0VV12_9ZZZZ